MTRDKLQKLMDEFFGSEDDDFEGGVFEENNELAEWSRNKVPYLFDVIDGFLKEKEAQKHVG